MRSLQRALAGVTVGMALISPSIVSAQDLSWTGYGSLASNSPVFGLAQDPQNPGTVFAASLGSGLQRTDDGKTWVAVDPTVLPKRLWKVAIDATTTQAGGSPMYVGSAGNGVFKSSDSGHTWVAAGKGLATTGALNVRAIALGRGMVVIGTSDGVYRSLDGGGSWQSAGLRGTDVSAVGFVVYGDPSDLKNNPPVIVAALDGAAFPSSRVQRSQDLGATWLPLKQGLSNDLVVTSVTPGHLLSDVNSRPLFLSSSGGVFKSDDGGNSWAQLPGLPAVGFSVVVPSPIDPNVVYVASDGGGAADQSGAGLGGVWRSNDRGGTWTAISGGITYRDVTALSVGRNSPATVSAVTFNPDKHDVAAFAVTDSAGASGTAELGLCPEAGANCVGPVQPGTTTSPIPQPSGGVPTPSCLASAAPASPGPGGSPVAGSSPGPSASPGPGASPGEGPAPSAAVGSASSPCPPRYTHPVPAPRNDVPVWIGAAVVVGFLLLLVARLVVVRRRV